MRSMQPGLSSGGVAMAEGPREGVVRLEMMGPSHLRLALGLAAFGSGL
jgi:hypothetical protein